MANEILSNGIIKIEKGSRLWYDEITENFEIINNLITDVKQNIQKIQANKDVNDTQEDSLTNLSTRIDTLSTELDNISTALQTLSDDLESYKQEVEDAGYLTEVSWNDVQDKPTLASVATSGDYSDLSGTPEIPTKVSDLDNDSEFISSVSWNDVQDKPNEFTPDTHTHAITDITDLDTELQAIKDRLDALEGNS